MPAKSWSCSASASAITPRRTSARPPAPSPAGTPTATASASSSTPRLHDDGAKTVLGQTGNWNGDDVVRIILQQPAAARFLVRKLYRFYVSETHEPPDSFLEPLAESFRKSDYDIAALLRTMLSSRHFFSDYAFRQRIKSPVEYVLGAVRAVYREYESEGQGTINR